MTMIKTCVLKCPMQNGTRCNLYTYYAQESDILTSEQLWHLDEEVWAYQMLRFWWLSLYFPNLDESLDGSYGPTKWTKPYFR